jgi:hypothetical protein
MKNRKKNKEITFDKELLKHWKKISTKAKLNWLENALRFGKLKSF